jgi:hypothetical protein
VRANLLPVDGTSRVDLRITWWVRGAAIAIAAGLAVRAATAGATEYLVFGVVLHVGLTVVAFRARLQVINGVVRRRSYEGWSELRLDQVTRVCLRWDSGNGMWAIPPHRRLELTTPDHTLEIAIGWWAGSRRLLDAVQQALSSPGPTSFSRRTWRCEIDEDSRARIDVI